MVIRTLLHCTGPLRLRKGRKRTSLENTWSTIQSQSFYIGENIVIVLVNVKSARMCNAADKVQTWSVDG